MDGPAPLLLCDSVSRPDWRAGQLYRVRGADRAWPARWRCGLPVRMQVKGNAQPMASNGATAPWLRLYFRSERAGIVSDLTGRLIEFIGETQRSLDCAIYDLRHPRVIAALQAVARSGKRLRIAYDASKERTGGLTGDPKPSGTEEALDAAGLLPYATPVHNS